MFVARLHKVNFEVNSRKHTVYFAEEATKVCAQALAGWANPGNAKAFLCETETECVEKLRQQLLRDITAWAGSWMDTGEVDFSAFTFNVAFEEVNNGDGAFWSGFQAVTGNRFKIHVQNEWR